MHPPKNAFTPLYIPITNIPTRDVQLRPEFLAVFKRANIEAHHLITLDDLPGSKEMEQILRPETTRWILVDHNALQGQLGRIYGSRVGGVIDHHDDEGKTPSDTPGEPRIIEKTGSCTSLVVDYCRQTWDMLSGAALSSGAAHGQVEDSMDDGAVVKRWDAEIAQLGLASILVDTANLEDANKTTEHDRQAVQYLEAKVVACPELSTSFDGTGLYKEVNAARKDIGKLKLEDILRKDYKQWAEGGMILGISSVVKPLAFLQQKAGDEASSQDISKAFSAALKHFAHERKLDLYTVMTTSTSAEGQFQRELVLWAFNDQAVSAAKQFASEARDELGLEDWHGSVGIEYEGHEEQEEQEWRRTWWQRQVQHSRKRVAPLLRKSML